LVGIVVGKDVGGARAPAPPHLHAHTGIGLDVLDVRGAPAVLGHDPEHAAAQAVADWRHALLAALAARRLEQRDGAPGAPALRDPPHERVHDPDREEPARAALHAMRVSSRPRPCASMATASPGSRYRFPWSGPSSRTQPPGSVHEPSTSPGRRRVSRAAWATLSRHV